MPDDLCSDQITCTDDTHSLCHWLCIFCNEARKEDGHPYTPRSITQLLVGIQQHIQDQKLPGVSILDGKILIFSVCIAL